MVSAVAGTFGILAITLLPTFDKTDGPGLPLKPSFSRTDAPSMLAEFDHLRTNPHLFALLSHYAQLGTADREAWQPRLMHLEGVQPPELVKLHGELLAWGRLDQNTGQVPGGYRINLAGLRAIRQVETQENEDENLEQAA